MNIEQVQKKLLVRINGATHAHEALDILNLVTAYEKLETVNMWRETGGVNNKTAAGAQASVVLDRAE